MGEQAPQLPPAPPGRDAIDTGLARLLGRIFVETWSRRGFRLDGTLGSLAELDLVALRLATPSDASCRCWVEVEDFLQGAGAYVGNVLVERCGGSWVEGPGGELQVNTVGGRRVRPFALVAERVRGGRTSIASAALRGH